MNVAAWSYLVLEFFSTIILLLIERFSQGLSICRFNSWVAYFCIILQLLRPPEPSMTFNKVILENDWPQILTTEGMTFALRISH